MILIKSSKEPFGWLGNMAGGYPVVWRGETYRSSEALFQCLRFPDDPDARDAIRSSESPVITTMGRSGRAAPARAMG